MTNAVAMGQVITTRWGNKNVAHMKNSFPMNLPRDLLNHPDLFTFMHVPSIEPRFLFLRRDLVSATFSSARRFSVKPRMQYEIQAAENEAMIIEASYALVCAAPSRRCFVVDYETLCNKTNAAVLMKAFTVANKPIQKRIEASFMNRECVHSGHDYSSAPHFTELALAYNPRVIMYPHAAVRTPIKQ